MLELYIEVLESLILLTAFGNKNKKGSGKVEVLLGQWETDQPVGARNDNVFDKMQTTKCLCELDQYIIE